MIFFVFFFVLAACLGARWFDLERTLMGFMLGYYVKRFVPVESVSNIKLRRVGWLALAIFMWLLEASTIIFSMYVDRVFFWYFWHQIF